MTKWHDKPEAGLQAEFAELRKLFPNAVRLSNDDDVDSDYVHLTGDTRNMLPKFYHILGVGRGFPQPEVVAEEQKRLDGQIVKARALRPDLFTVAA